MSAGQVQVFVSTLLKQCNASVEQPFLTALSNIFIFSSSDPDHSTIQLNDTTILSDTNASNFHHEFSQNHLDHVLRHLWSLYTPGQSSPLPSLLSSAALHSHSITVLRFLSDSLKQSALANQRDLAENLLDQFIVNRRGTCHLLLDLNNQTCNFDEAYGLLLSLPSLVANVFQGQVRACQSLRGDEFIVCVLTDWIDLINKDQLSDHFVLILASFFGRMCFTGYGDSVWNFLIPIFSAKSQQWISKLSSILQHIPTRFIDSALQPLFLKSYSSGLIYRCLGDFIISNLRLLSLIKKIIFLRHYSSCNVLHNIFGYLRLSSPTKMTQMCLPLLKVWADGNVIRSTSYQQQLYITSALIICVALMSEEQLQSLEMEAVAELLPGVSAHLESPLLAIRLLGMVAGEYLTTRWNLSTDGNTLKFEYDESDDTRLLKLLFVPRSADQQPRINISNLPEALQRVTLETENIASVSQIKMDPSPKEDLDSDDDEFKPMPMNNDAPLKRGKEPRYIRECMDGLLLSKPEDMDTFTACVNSAEHLIYAHKTSVSEVALEFTRIMLHSTPQCHIDNFPGKRHRALLALCLVCPKQVAPYLCVEFYQPHYSLTQRMDMLQVLADTANTLSMPDQYKPEHTSTVTIRDITPSEKDKSPTPTYWKEIIAERLEKKTRRFTNGPKNSLPPNTVNKFAPYAGEFFFDLLRLYDRRTDGSFDLLGRDYIVLSRLLYTLGIIFHAAINAPVLRKMTLAMLDYLWTVRSHPEPSVRRGVVFALCMVWLTAPGHFFFPELDSEIQEWRFWLDRTNANDSDAECRELSHEALSLLSKKYQEVIKAVTSD